MSWLDRIPSLEQTYSRVEHFFDVNENFIFHSFVIFIRVILIQRIIDQSGTRATQLLNVRRLEISSLFVICRLQWLIIEIIKVIVKVSFVVILGRLVLQLLFIYFLVLDDLALTELDVVVSQLEVDHREDRLVCVLVNFCFSSEFELNGVDGQVIELVIGGVLELEEDGVL